MRDTPNRIYLVMGSTGEYADNSEWPVAAYIEEPHADEHAKAAEVRAEELENWKCEGCGAKWYWHGPSACKFGVSRPVNQHDNKMSLDYTGTRYWVEEVSFFDTFEDSKDKGK